ncbi:hypothetical protein ACFL2P_02130 [Candidatus Moduliflexota bacterium]
MKLFTKPGCEKCDWVKDRMPEEAKERVNSFDILTADGLAELAYHELVGVAEKQLPILLTREGKVVTGAIRINREITGTC